MDHIVLFLVTLTLTAVVYVSAAACHLRRVRRLRTIEARIGALGVDPYFAAVVRGQETAAAAAELLLAGVIRIDHHAVIRLVNGTDDGGSDSSAEEVRAPAHPIPAALLEAVRRRHPKHVVLGRIMQRDRAYIEQCGMFRAAQEELFPKPLGGTGWAVGCLGALGVYAVVAFAVFAAMATLESPPHGLVQGAAAGGTLLALTLLLLSPALWKRLPRPDPDPLHTRCLQLRHPALDGLDEKRGRLVNRSMFLGRRTRAPRPRRAPSPSSKGH
ncbi:hypothetical protein ACFV9D_32420 [Streptomyces sp. NPDC059875]|uniref:hypothetical protein n=1 Tax=unclassified Streptomyces TaxID=2593676 RepID=UPI003653C56C